MTDSDKIAAFIAQRGVTRVPEGAAIYSTKAKDWARRVRGEPTEEDMINERRVIVGANGREYVSNGLGEWLA